MGVSDSVIEYWVEYSNTASMVTLVAALDKLMVYSTSPDEDLQEKDDLKLLISIADEKTNSSLVSDKTSRFEAERFEPLMVAERMDKVFLTGVSSGPQLMIMPVKNR